MFYDPNNPMDAYQGYYYIKADKKYTKFYESIGSCYEIMHRQSRSSRLLTLCLLGYIAS